MNNFTSSESRIKIQSSLSSSYEQVILLNVQDSLDGFIVVFVERNIVDVPNGMCGVIYRLHVAGPIGRT
mgnify:CR=1 FL=1